ncbi:MAG: hypothetical protein M0000_01785 [Actinomycetota bacterium]|nr:hypothetical protein [Actinomycetota bacterium]
MTKVCGPVNAGFARCFFQVLLNPSTWHGQQGRTPSPPAGGSATPNGGYPSDLQAPYNRAAAGSAGGPGITVAIIDAYSDPYLASDPSTYRSLFKLPARGTHNAFLAIVNQSGGTRLPRQQWLGHRGVP